MPSETLSATPSRSDAPDVRRAVPDVERLTLEIGRRLFARTRRNTPSGLHPKSVPDRLMRFLMRDEDLRFRLLRFVDVFPALRSPAEVARHLTEYLTSPSLATGLRRTSLSASARFAARLGEHVPMVGSFVTQKAIEQMGGQFIAGATPREVARTISAMEAQGFLFSLDLLGEFVASERQATAFTRRYLEMIETFERLLGPKPSAAPSHCGPRCNVSIKLSSLTSKFEPMDPEGTSAAVRARLRPLIRAARKHGVFINVDMEKFEYRDLTLRIIQDLLSEDEFRDFEHLGTVAQAYLADADDCLVRFLDWLESRRQPFTIRLVKGAYWDSEQVWARAKDWPVPVITEKRLTDAMYERCTRLLLERHHIVRTAVASHNARSVAHALALKKALRVPDDRFECQMLYGMAGPIKDALRDMGVPVRIYTPCGALIPGMAYLVRRILENTSNESFLRQRFAEGRGDDELLRDPKQPAAAPV